MRCAAITISISKDNQSRAALERSRHRLTALDHKPGVLPEKLLLGGHVVMAFAEHFLAQGQAGQGLRLHNRGRLIHRRPPIAAPVPSSPPRSDWAKPGSTPLSPRRW